MSVAPIVGDSTASERLLVGFAEGPTTAAGLAIDPADLDATYPFRETSDARVISVTPLLSSGGPSFHVVREGHPLKQARAVPATSSFLFGLSDAGFARQPLAGTAETVWALESKTNVTDPRVASLSGQGHAITFRQGGTGGSLHLGWLTEDGHAMAGPFQIKSPAGLLGTPSVAAAGGRAVVTYAGRNSDTDPWTVHLAMAKFGEAPQAAVALPQPAGGPGGDAIAPNLIALSNQRWLLQWSEGAQGQRQVRIQTLDDVGQPLGPAHTVSPVGSNSGQGLLWSSRGRAVSLFMVSVGKGAELWATPIHCP